MGTATKIRTRSQNMFFWLETPDGFTLELNSGANHLVSANGLGGAEIQNITQAGVNQHGVSWEDYRLNPRLMTFTLRRLSCGCYGHCNTLKTQNQTLVACDPPQTVLCNGSEITIEEITGMVQPSVCSAEQSYLSSAAYLANYLRPNRGGPMYLCVSLPDASVKRIAARLDMMPEFSFGGPRPTSYQTPFRLLAASPFWEDYNHLTIANAEIASTFSERVNVRNCGTAEVFPLIVITGPVINPAVSNLTTGLEVRLNYTIDSGESITIELEPTTDNRHRKTIVSTTEGNIIGVVNNAGHMSKFSMVPQSVLAPWGINELQFSGSGASYSLTSFTLVYRQKYHGVIL